MDWRIRHYGRVLSTQGIARELVAACANIGTVIVADEQEQGQGRFGRSWVSPQGGLYASLVVTPVPLLCLLAGIAVAEALRSVGIEAALKWPNDVLVGEKKIAGILIDIIADRAIVGIGVNLAAAPVATAASVARETAMKVGRDDLLALILQRFTSLSMAQETVLARYQALSATIGQAVCVEIGTPSSPRRIFGRAVGIDSTGRLIVAAGKVRHCIASGECVHLEVSSQAEE